MLLQLLAGVACLLAALLQFGVYRSPDLHDTVFRHTGRRIMVVALTIAAIYCLYEFLTRGRPNVMYLFLILMGMSQSLYAISDLLPHLEKEHSWTSRLTNSQ